MLGPSSRRERSHGPVPAGPGPAPSPPFGHSAGSWRWDQINARPLLVDKSRDLILICIDCSVLWLPICIMDLSEAMMWAWQVLSQ